MRTIIKYFISCLLLVSAVPGAVRDRDLLLVEVRGFALTRKGLADYLHSPITTTSPSSATYEEVATSAVANADFGVIGVRAKRPVVVACTLRVKPDGRRLIKLPVVAGRTLAWREYRVPFMNESASVGAADDRPSGELVWLELVVKGTSPSLHWMIIQEHEPNHLNERI